MIDLEELLFEIFEELRQRRVPLGMSDYILALKGVYELTNPGDLEDIKDLCRLFWAKSFEDQQLLDETFDIKINMQLQVMPEEAQQHISPPATKSPLTPESTTPSSEHPPLKRQHQQRNQPMIIRKAHHQPINATNSKLSDHNQPIRYHLTPRAPMDKRDMAGIWRKLRRPQREGPLEELDVQATTDSLSRIGFIYEPVLQSRRRNQARLILLIDQGGSMDPFALFTEALLDSVLRSGSLRFAKIFYFHDCPEDYLYTYPTLLGARPLEDILIEHCRSSSVLLVSDAGAARGHYESIRAKVTKEFLDRLSHQTYLYAWLNPVPKFRWTGTTAWQIAQLLPMFQISWEDLNDVVNILRGQSFTGIR